VKVKAFTTAGNFKEEPEVYKFFAPPALDVENVMAVFAPLD